jgi:hypothetical protein
MRASRTQLEFLKPFERSVLFEDPYYGYLNYAIQVSIHKRINNRSWIVNSYDGAMKLAVLHGRRNAYSLSPNISRFKFGISVWSGLTRLYL